MAIRPKSGLRPLTVKTLSSALLHCERGTTGLHTRESLAEATRDHTRATLGSEEGPSLHCIELDRPLLHYIESTNLLKSLEKFPLFNQ